MPGPGEYLPDATEGITRVEDLPKPKIIQRSRDFRQPCPQCGHSSYRHRRAKRVLHDLGDLVPGRPHDIHLTYSVHHCTQCDNYFNADMSDLALPRATTPTALWPWRSVWWSKTACPTRPPVGTSGETIGCSSPWPRSRTGLRPGGKKAEARIDADYLDWALADFSGYIAADELYDGPYCVLSIVDNRTFKRISYRVLDHDPTHDDIREFFTAFRDALHVRGLVLRGITTDGSPLYPGPIAAIFPGVRHQVCEFHVIAEITKAVLHAVSKVRKQLAAEKTPLGRGRPRTKEAKRAARRNERLQQKIGDLFEHRHLFVAHHLTPAETSNASADHPRLASVAHAPRDHGRGLPPVRPSLPHGHGLGQIGQAADACAAFSARSARPSASCSLPIWKRR